MRRVATAAFIVALVAITATASSEVPDKWSTGELTEAKHDGDFWDYRIEARDEYGGDAYIGRSSVPLHVKVGVCVKFEVVKSTMYILDQDGKTQETEYLQQELFVTVGRHKKPKC